MKKYNKPIMKVHNPHYGGAKATEFDDINFEENE